MGAHAELKIKDHGWDAFWKRANDLIRMKSARVKVGVLSGTEKGGLHVKGGALTVAEIAAVLQFGTQQGVTPKIPARPFLTQAFDTKRAHLKEMGGKLMAGVIFGEITLDKALNMMGAYLASEAKKVITAGIAPPNAPSTALAKAKTGKTKSLFRSTKGGSGGVKGLGRAIAQAGVLASVKPLIDTGRLLGAITWAIDTGHNEPSGEHE